MDDAAPSRDDDDARVVLALLLTVVLMLGCLAAAGVRAAVLRRRLARRPGVFPCTVRVVRGAFPRLASRPPGHPCRGEWVHDVLVLHRGRVLGWAQPLPVRMAEDLTESAGAAAEARLGAGAVQLLLRLDNNAVIGVAAPGSARELLAGPFLAIAAHRSPPGVSGLQGR